MLGIVAEAAIGEVVIVRVVSIVFVVDQVSMTVCVGEARALVAVSPRSTATTE